MSAKNGRIHNKRHLVEVDTLTAYLAFLESCLSFLASCISTFAMEIGWSTKTNLEERMVAFEAVGLLLGSHEQSDAIRLIASLIAEGIKVEKEIPATCGNWYLNITGKFKTFRPVILCWAT
ncbi:unnamed protein product [Coffea canephora]|uniref:DH200=94 genomic scaffold, scaffold_2284 n=1 Tax=Coffea canephora TaxID=49390 RepID=A0A068VK89_COFCA|nr:unnamed protein product [Coffea canephora]